MNAPHIHRSSGRTSSQAAIAALAAGAIALGLAATAVSQAFESSKDPSVKAATLLAGKTPDPARGLPLARALVARTPLNPFLLRAMALSANRLGQPATANTLMTAASKLSWRDLPTDAWLADHQIRSGQYAAAIPLLDAMLRQRPDLQDGIYPPMGALMTDPKAAKVLAERLSQRPAWRNGFLAAINVGDHPVNSEAVFALLSDLKATHAPPLENEVSYYVHRLIQGQRYDEALLNVFLFLPQDRLKDFNIIFNGDFDDIDGIEPLDWAGGSSDESSEMVELPPSRPKDRALHVFYNGRTTKPIVSQVVIIPAGTYRLSFDASSPTPDTSSLLQWAVRCVTGAPIARSQIHPIEEWRRYTLDLEIPASCGAQFLELTPTPNDRQTNVEAWYDKISIERIADG